MKQNILTLLSLLILTSACSKVIKEEPYLKANSSKTLSESGQKNMPNTNNTLAIPKVKQVHNGVPNDKPPEMAFAKKRSQKEDVIINEVYGRPTIELYNEVSPWELMIADHGSNWTLKSEMPEKCQVMLNYNDPIAREQDERGALKRFFSSKSSYEDKSGEYKLDCIVEENRNLITISKSSGAPASSHVVDDIFAQMFSKATASE